MQKINMFSDHENLLSTFGKDFDSSNRESRKSVNSFKDKKMTLVYDMEPKTRYQKLLSQRRTLMIIQKTQQPKIKHSNNNNNDSKKLKTQSDIEYLNSRIRKSISGIAETICKSKTKSNFNSKSTQFQASRSSIKRQSQLVKQTVQSHNSLKNTKSKKRQPSINNNDKENFNINNFEEQERIAQKFFNRNQYLKNSTKKKGNFFNGNLQCPIKSSFSVGINSQSSSVQSSNKELLSRKYSRSKPDVYFCEKSNENKQKTSFFNKKHSEMNLGRQMQETLKKQFKLLAQSDYIRQQNLQAKGDKSDKVGTQFIFDQEDLQQVHQKEEDRLPNFNKIQFPKKAQIKQNKKLYTQSSVQLKINHHPKLIQALMKQIQLDYDLRHAKHMFSGIQQPYYANAKNNTQSQCKWHRLNKELRNLGLQYPVQTIKKIFLPSQEQIDPFLSVGKPHEELIYSLIYAYETAQIHWQKQIYQQWQHWDLRDIDLTIQNIDRDRKGYITVEDISAFISMQTGNQYKNRDLILIYKRLINGFSSKKRVYVVKQVQSHKRSPNEQKYKLKFRALIDFLIKPFNHHSKKESKQK